MEEDIEILSAAISELLEQQSHWTEHALIERLKQPPYQLFDDAALRDPLSLFQTHFLVFHCLYQLQAAWRQRQWANLSIHALAIDKYPWSAAEAGLTEVDPLTDYYLDLTQLTNTSGDDVEQLLEQFWQQMAKGDNGTQYQLSLDRACEVMEIERPVSAATLKRQYRRLVHRHHPDKGGSVAAMQQVKAAYQRLSMERVNE